MCLQKIHSKGSQDNCPHREWFPCQFAD